MTLEILDTTLRDGEQTSGVSFNASEKLTIAQLIIEELRVDRLEIASARVSEGEYEGAKKILDWANVSGHLEKIEVLGFVDQGVSLKWIQKAGGKVLNLLCKGSLKHCENQLKKSVGEHIEDIKQCISLADKMHIQVNVYLEDWSNGMLNSPQVVYQLIDELKRTSVKRIMLPDTLGILNHRQTAQFCSDLIERYPNVHFDFHAHNDYDLSVSNVFEAIKSGVRGVHTTLNGLGERAGNVPLSSVIGILKDHLNVNINLDETNLYHVSKVVESFSGVRIPPNKPLIGEYVFTQTSGIHADGDTKDNLYQTALSPDRFGRSYTYALGKLSGKANINKNLKELGIQLTKEETQKVTERIIELGDKKESITKEDLPYIVNDVLGSGVRESKVEILNYSLSVAKGLRSSATVSIAIDGIINEQTASGDGQYDAFMNALKKIYERLGRVFPRLIDYEVQIPPGGNTDALVITTIMWESDEKHFKTKGLDSDQTVAAIKATTRMLNIIESKELVHGV
ncbi:MAG: alpha-isopropylmalate synthase regulatory domain-containing protein [Bacteroidota bacterium]